jgi:response regulator of citrate/malate metabolism
MIRAFVVDDDFRVARIHAAAVDRVDGFQCLGVAHTAADARTALHQLRPDLVLLDIYLPDEHGLQLLRSLQTEPDSPDFLVISAARDIDNVQSAIRAGAIYYLVKPFGFAQLREQLEAYRDWHRQLADTKEADQSTVDNLYRTLRPSRPAGQPRRQLPPTMQLVLDCVSETTDPVSALQVAEKLGISRPTAQRYLSELEQRKLVELVLEYGSPGRPGHLYRPAANDPPGRRQS